MQYIGHLPKTDPLYFYLRDHIMPQTGITGAEDFRVFSSKSSHAVYIYEERRSNTKVVGKFFAAGEPDRERAKRKMYREYHNINEFRCYLGDCHYAAKALGCREDLDCLLVVEYCYGEPLDSIIRRAVNSGDDGLLYRKLKALAYFLATLHNRSARPVMVDFHRICNYFELLIWQLRDILAPKEDGYFRHLASLYRHDPLMYQDQEVLVHGDATPANFFFGDDMYVITFDLERMHRSDRLFDTGRIAGELQHFFLQYTGNKYAAEPFIGNFMWEYATHFPDRDRAFAAITARLPFYMGMTLLRIARNTYLTYHYRRGLIEEAKLTLQRQGIS